MVKANADVKGLTYCVLQCLQLAGLHDSLALYPEFAPRFSRGLRGELSYNLGAGGGSAEVSVLSTCLEGLGGAGEPGEVGRGCGWWRAVCKVWPGMKAPTSGRGLHPVCPSTPMRPAQHAQPPLPALLGLSEAALSRPEES